jgi:light-harvesting protein B-800-850 alpha chain
MNQGRIWCVVNPTVGLPLFLGSVAVIALVVHASVLSHTDWFSGYWQGHSKAKVAAAEGSTGPVAVNGEANGVVISMAPVASKAGSGETSFVITVAPKAVQTAQVDAKTAPGPVAVALATAGTK